MNLTTEENWLHFMFPNCLRYISGRKEKICQEMPPLAEASAEKGVRVLYNLDTLLWYHVREKTPESLVLSHVEKSCHL